MLYYLLCFWLSAWSSANKNLEIRTKPLIDYVLVGQEKKLGIPIILHIFTGTSIPVLQQHQFTRPFASLLQIIFSTNVPQSKGYLPLRWCPPCGQPPAGIRSPGPQISTFNLDSQNYHDHEQPLILSPDRRVLPPWFASRSLWSWHALLIALSKRTLVEAILLFYLSKCNPNGKVWASDQLLGNSGPLARYNSHLLSRLNPRLDGCL